MNYGRGQRLAQMLQMQQSPMVSNQSQGGGVTYGPQQNGAMINPPPRQQAQLYPRRPKTPGMVNPQGGVDRGSFDGQ